MKKCDVTKLSSSIRPSTLPTGQKQAEIACAWLHSFSLGTIHKRRLLRGGGRGAPTKGDERRYGGETLFWEEETSFLRPQKDLKGNVISPTRNVIRI